MIRDAVGTRQIWNTFQEPRCPTSLPNGSLLLLSALDNGWQISKVEVKPSWDQNDFIYVLTLQRPADRQRQELILPRNAAVDNLLQEMGSAFQSRKIVSPTAK